MPYPPIIWEFVSEIGYKNRRGIYRVGGINLLRNIRGKNRVMMYLFEIDGNREFRKGNGDRVVE